MEFRVSQQLFDSLSCGMQEYFFPSDIKRDDFSEHWGKRQESIDFFKKFPIVDSNKKPSNNVAATPTEKESSFPNSDRLKFHFLSDTFTFGYFMKVPIEVEGGDEIVFEIGFNLSKNLVDIIARITLCNFGKWSYYIRPIINRNSTIDTVSNDQLQDELKKLMNNIMKHERDSHHDTSASDDNHLKTKALQQYSCKLKWKATPGSGHIGEEHTRLVKMKMISNNLKPFVEQQELVTIMKKPVTQKAVHDLCANFLNKITNAENQRGVNEISFASHLVRLASIYYKRQQFLHNHACPQLRREWGNFLHGRIIVLEDIKADEYYFLNAACAIVVGRPMSIKFPFSFEDISPPLLETDQLTQTIVFEVFLMDDIYSNSSTRTEFNFEIFPFVERIFNRKNRDDLRSNCQRIGFKIPLVLPIIPLETQAVDREEFLNYEDLIREFMKIHRGSLDEELILPPLDTVSLVGNAKPSSLTSIHGVNCWFQMMQFETSRIYNFGQSEELQNAEKWWKSMQDVGFQPPHDTCKSIATVKIITKKGEGYDQALIDYATTMLYRPQMMPLSFSILLQGLRSIRGPLQGDAQLALFLISDIEEYQINALVKAVELNNQVALQRIACGFHLNYNFRSRREGVDEKLLLRIYQAQVGVVNIPEWSVTKMEGIGHGAFGEVFNGKLGKRIGDTKLNVSAIMGDNELPEGTKVALKRLTTDPTIVNLQQEATYMMLLKDSNYIVKCWGLGNELEKYILMEYADIGNMSTFIHKLSQSHPLSEDLTKRVKLLWMLDIAHGLDDLHHFHFTHWDLHTKNILLFSSTATLSTRGHHAKIPIAKLADFGKSRRNVHEIDNYGSKGSSAASTFNGDENELFRAEDSKKTTKLDIFMFGKVCCYIMGYVKDVDDRSRKSKEFTALRDNEPSSTEEELDKEIKLFIKSLFKEMDSRPTASLCVIILSRLINRFPVDDSEIPDKWLEAKDY